MMEQPHEAVFPAAAAEAIGRSLRFAAEEDTGPIPTLPQPSSGAATRSHRECLYYRIAHGIEFRNSDGARRRRAAGGMLPAVSERGRHSTYGTEPYVGGGSRRHAARGVVSLRLDLLGSAKAMESQISMSPPCIRNSWPNRSSGYGLAALAFWIPAIRGCRPFFRGVLGIPRGDTQSRIAVQFY